MNCEQLKIWINESEDGSLFDLPADIVSHLENCESCKTRIESMQGAYLHMQSQKQATLTPEQTDIIIESLLKLKATRINMLQKPVFIISRIAAIFIIALGITLGIIAGELITNTQNTQSNPWDTEFEMLTDNSNYYFTLFE